MPGLVIPDLLVASGLLTSAQMERAQQVMQQKHCPLEEAVLDLQLLSRPVLYGAIADQLRVPYVDLEEYLPDSKAREFIPERMARQHHTFPLFKIQNGLVVAMSDPTNLVAIDALRQASGCVIEAYLSSEAEIAKAIDQAYGTRGETERFLEELSRHPGAVESRREEGKETPVSKLVDLVMTQAVRDRASDVHLEPEEDTLRIRFRIDGVLHEVPSPPKTFEAALISRLKVLADLDIAETRIPQDGHFKLEVDNRGIDVRISTLPTVHGENVVMRILDSTEVFVGLDRLGLSPQGMEQLEKAILKPHGIVLCTGPTGSGKTTTLYSALMRISSIQRNIITIEDPVEYRLNLIRQVQINPKIGITFANGLRSILRQDPDVIMVGEIRDGETAELAIQAALTGHLVLSTLHTNDAPSSVTRLLNMGIEPFLVSASVICVIAQRLVRTICESCRAWYEPPPVLLERLGLSQGTRQPVKMAKGKGCPQCKGTGYRGRTGIYEMMMVDDEIREQILAVPSVVALREMARKKGMKLLSEEGLAKVLSGVTTLEEVSRVTEREVVE